MEWNNSNINKIFDLSNVINGFFFGKLSKWPSKKEHQGELLVSYYGRTSLFDRQYTSGMITAKLIQNQYTLTIALKNISDICAGPGRRDGEIITH